MTWRDDRAHKRWALVDREGTSEGTDDQRRPPALSHSSTEKVLMTASTNAELLVNQEGPERYALRAETGHATNSAIAFDSFH